MRHASQNPLAGLTRPMAAPFDVKAVTAWLSERVPYLEPPIEVSVVSGGKSNLTYVTADAGGRRWILRRQPLRGVIPSAHDMAREHRIVSSLRDSAVPVPATVGYESDPAYIGAPFFAMEFVEGHVLRDPVLASELLTENARFDLGASTIDSLLALHAVKPEMVGLADLSRSQDYIARQLRAWGRQLDVEQSKPDRRTQVLLEVLRGLVRSIPPQQRVSIVHGDYRLDNLVVSESGRVEAVLDWELSTLGDPVADIATLDVYWSDPGDSFFPLETATIASGFPRRHEMVRSYISQSSLDFSRFPYYLAFASWRLAVILEGVLRRHDIGAYGDTPNQDWGSLRDTIPKLGEAALDHLRADAKPGPTVT